MKSRLWYPQLDVASTARRLVRLLREWNVRETSLERLFVADYFLASPELLGDIKMPDDLRKIYSNQKFPKRKDSFVSFPSPVILFHSMNPIQVKALASLVAKEVVDRDEYALGKARLTEVGMDAADRLSSLHAGSLETSALAFLGMAFSRVDFSTKTDLRARTGLRYYG